MTETRVQDQYRGETEQVRREGKRLLINKAENAIPPHPSVIYASF